MITREKARDIAAEFLRLHPGYGSVVTQVLGWEEIAFQRPRPYGISTQDLMQCWICYVLHPGEFPMLRSSTIVAVSRSTGEVQYSGSANDEG